MSPESDSGCYLSHRQAWADHFDAQNIQYAFFSAFNATAAQEQADRQRRRQLGEEEEIRFAEDQAQAVGGGAEHDQDDQDVEDQDSDDSQDDEDPALQTALAESFIKEQDGSSDATRTLENELASKLSVQQDDPSVETAAGMKGLFDDDVDHDPRTRVLTVLELEQLFEKVAPAISDFATSYNPKPDKLMVGLVGYPNVGKSSTINALLGSKKVSVSATPGKTKHFQTLPFSNKVTLCDCPGLVFPQFLSLIHI